jgi:hypothetical protein
LRRVAPKTTIGAVNCVESALSIGVVDQAHASCRLRAVGANSRLSASGSRVGRQRLKGPAMGWSANFGKDMM